MYLKQQRIHDELRGSKPPVTIVIFFIKNYCFYKFNIISDQIPKRQCRFLRFESLHHISDVSVIHGKGVEGSFDGSRYRSQNGSES